MPIPIVPIVVGGLIGMFAGSQIDDALEPSPAPAESGGTSLAGVREVFNVGNAIKLAAFGGAALVALRVAKEAKLL